MEPIIIFGAKYLFLLSPLLLAYFFFKAPREKRKEILILASVSLPLTYLLGVVARELYFNPRPFMVGGFTPLIPHVPDNGFPSDHMLLLAALASLVMVYDKRWSLLLWVVALLVGEARIYAGVHHIVDMVGSVLIALVSAAVAYAIIQRLWNKNNQTNF